MNRYARHSLLGLGLLCCFFLAGCSSPSPMSMDNFNKVQLGMTIEEVSAIFGFPVPIKPEEPNLGKFYVQQNHAGVDRRTDWETDESTYDTFETKELGGVNKKQIIIRYDLGKVGQKDQVDLDK